MKTIVSIDSFSHFMMEVITNDELTFRGGIGSRTVPEKQLVLRRVVSFSFCGFDSANDFFASEFFSTRFRIFFNSKSFNSLEKF